MKPRTKLQVRVFGLSKTLPKLSDDQKKWAFKNCLNHLAYRTKKTVSCLDCGHVWPRIDDAKSCKCPSCDTRLTIKDTRLRKYEQTRYSISLVDVVEEFQVIRYFEIYSYHKTGEAPKRYIQECVQQWFTPNGKLTIVGQIQSFGFRNGFNGSLEIRVPSRNYWSNDYYNVFTGKFFPGENCLPIYKRNGFTNKIKDVYTITLFRKLLDDHILETLIKSKQHDLMRQRLRDRSHNISTYWNSIKICIRHKYIIKNAITWLDYMDLLRYFGKDLRNPKFICPKDLRTEHDRLVAKKTAIQRAERLERELMDIQEKAKRAKFNQDDYSEAKGNFFGLKFFENNLTVKVLETIQEFIDEGDIHEHCIYTNKYYANEHSLCFSALIGGKSVETVEVSLRDYKITQSRGFKNKPSPYHEQIITLVEKNMHIIRKRHKELNKKAA